jgi:hypothetical protein
MSHVTTRRAPRRRDLLGTATASAACVSALFLMSGCQPAPRVSAFADTPAQQAAEAKLQQAGADQALVPFDEKFYVPPPEAESTVASAP